MELSTTADARVLHAEDADRPGSLAIGAVAGFDEFALVQGG
jgi:hypothetical protein